MHIVLAFFHSSGKYRNSQEPPLYWQSHNTLDNWAKESSPNQRIRFSQRVSGTDRKRLLTKWLTSWITKQEPFGERSPLFGCNRRMCFQLSRYPEAGGKKKPSLIRLPQQHHRGLPDNGSQLKYPYTIRILRLWNSQGTIPWEIPDRSYDTS